MMQQNQGAEPTILFLPGAAGDGSFWKGVGNRLPNSWDLHYLNWPGLGHQPHRSDIGSMADLCRLAASFLVRPSAIVAQSMGGIIAVQLGLQHPELVTHLVLTATSGGVDVASLGGGDWRSDFLMAFPHTARWILTEKPDLTNRLAELDIPTLLLWGDQDPISPVAVGKYLAQNISAARLVVVPGGQHSLAADMPDQVAAWIHAHLTDRLGRP